MHHEDSHQAADPPLGGPLADEFQLLAPIGGGEPADSPDPAPPQPEPTADKNSLVRWWKRECGGREVCLLAFPLVVSTISWSLMNFTDRMLLSWWSTNAMAASLPAGMMHWTMICFFFGVAQYVNTFVAQYYGAGRADRIGSAVWQGMRIGWYSTPLFLLMGVAAPWLFRIFGHAPELMWVEVLYFQTLSLGAGGTVIAGAMSTFFTGRGQTKVVMVVDAAAALLNVVLDYLWIFGKLGFPAGGIEGAGWATAFSQWFKVAAFALLIVRALGRGDIYGFGPGRRFDKNLFLRLARFGGPSGLQWLIEAGVFSLFVLFMSRLGVQEAAATTAAFSINGVAFVPMLGIGIAVTTLVGQRLGAGQPDLAARATWTGVVLGLGYSLVFGVFYLFTPKLFLLGHAAGGDPQEYAKLEATTVVLLRFVAAYCLFDALQILFSSALKGAGDTAFVLMNTVMTAFTALIVGYVGSRLFETGLHWWWSVITCWILTLGFVYCGRFLQGKWRSMRVIEPEL